MRDAERRLSRLEALAAEVDAAPEIAFGPTHLLARLADSTCPTCRVRSQILERALDGDLWRLDDRCPECGAALDDALICPPSSPAARIVQGVYCPLRDAVAAELRISPRHVPRKPELACSAAVYWLAVVFRGEERARELLRSSIEARPSVSLVRDHGPCAGESIEGILEHHRTLAERHLQGRYWISEHYWIDSDGYLIDGAFAQAYMTPEELERLERELPAAAAELRAGLVAPYSRYDSTESLLQLVYTTWAWRAGAPADHATN